MLPYVLKIAVQQNVDGQAVLLKQAAVVAAYGSGTYTSDMKVGVHTGSASWNKKNRPPPEAEESAIIAFWGWGQDSLS